MKKTVIVTGATKGIGLAISERLTEKNYQVIGIARNASVTPFPGKLILADLSNAKETTTALNQIQSEYQIDAIVNNVGIAMPQALGEINLDDLQAVYDLNVRTAVQVTQAFLSKMKENSWGRIINISSRAIFGVKNRSSYAAAKSALIGLTRTWALELAEYNITVNAIAPGPIETELFRKARPIGSAAEKEALVGIPMGRIGHPQEIAAAVDFLLTEDAGFITGQTLCIDGGSSL